MMRALWSAASGMIAQQTNVDTISHNLANVNTTGYKSEITEFKTLLYQNLQTPTTTANGEQKPIPAQVGLGTRVASITSLYNQQGAFQATDSDTAFAIQGKGFFAVNGGDGETYYTRDGNFFFSRNTDGTYNLSDASGHPVLDIDNQPIRFPGTINGNDVKMTEIQVTDDGQFFYIDTDGNAVNLEIQIALYQFNNPSGLEKRSGNLLRQTEASGEPISEAYDTGITISTIHQGYLERSSVQVADEMVNLIIAQRAYELNSKAITTSDTMLEQANNLKR